MTLSGRSRRRPSWWAGRHEVWGLECLLLVLLLLVLAVAAAAEGGGGGDPEEQAPAKVDEALYSRQLYVMGTCAAVALVRFLFRNRVLWLTTYQPLPCHRCAR